MAIDIAINSKTPRPATPLRLAPWQGRQQGDFRLRSGRPSGRVSRQVTLFTRFHAALVALVLVTASAAARADDTIQRPGDHPAYNFELEPHLLLGSDDAYAWGGWGLGVRVSIPLVDNGFVSTINNNVAISFGLDIEHYDGCWYNGNCTATYFDFPVVMQWNFYVAQRWSVFGEPGIVLYHGFIANCPNGVDCPNGHPNGDDVGIEPAIYLGGRYYLSNNVTLTARIGFPSCSFGISFFP
jgi:hypothetical protein